jgi:hypothetical protein
MYTNAKYQDYIFCKKAVFIYIHTYIGGGRSANQDRQIEKTFGCELRENLRFVGFNPNPDCYIN